MLAYPRLMVFIGFWCIVTLILTVDDVSGYPNKHSENRLGDVDEISKKQLVKSDYFDYSKYVDKFKKTYSPIEMVSKALVFMARTLRIFQHNVQYHRKQTGYFQTQNMFTDMTDQELKENYGGSTETDLRPVVEAQMYPDRPADSLESIFESSIKQDKPTINFLDEYKKILNNNPSLVQNEKTNQHNEVESIGVKNEGSSASDEDNLVLQRLKVYAKQLSNDLPDSDLDIRSLMEPSILNGGMNDSVEYQNVVEPSIDHQDLTTASNRSEIAKKAIKYNVDWRITGCITPARAQYSCNSCYAFTTLSMMEYFYCRETRLKSEFSPQYIIDCGSKTDLNGCKGGKLSNVGRFISSYGIDLETDYPYVGPAGECSSTDADHCCKKNMGQLKPKITAWQQFDSMIDWYKWLRKSPLIVGINTPSDFHSYGGGIHDGLNCDTNMTHSMLLVGSGLQGDQQFWLLKNSYSIEWGEQGYFRLAKSAPLRCFDSAIVARAKFNL